jgi:LruC domain-containing protein
MRTLHTILALLIIALAFQSCRKDDNNNNTDEPKAFTDLRVDKAFNFESFQNVQTAIQLTNSRIAGGEIVQIYDGHPNEGGKLILTGTPNAQGMFNLPLRIASRLEEVYVARLNAYENNEYVAVPVSGNTISFSFANKDLEQKVVDPFCDCDPADILPNNFNSNLTIPSGETRCVSAGNHANIHDLIIRSGATLKVCGTASVNKYKQDSPEGTIQVSPSGTLTLPKYNLNYTLNNYGTVNFSGYGSISLNGPVENWGVITSSIKMITEGEITNYGTFTTNKDLDLNPGSVFTNYCKLLLTSEDDFKQKGRLINNGFIYVDGDAEFTGNGNDKTILGQASLIKADEFVINGAVEGPSSGYAQIKARDKGRVNASAELSNLDLCADEEEYSSNASYSNVTTDCIDVPIPDCGTFEAPEITSSLQIGGLVGDPLTPYQITATGTEPITYTVSGLPAGLSFNANTATISGTPATAGTYNVELTASNTYGQDVKMLVIQITQPVDPPVITSVLTKQATVDEPLSYTLTATGAGPITLNATNLPDGLIFNAETGQITGSPSTAGVYNITLSAANTGGTTTETLVLTVGTPPVITNELTATGTAGDQFSTFTVTATGSPEITIEVSNLPQNLSFDPSTNQINGTPTFAGEYNVLITATNDYGNDIKTLIITIAEGLQAPEITSALTASGAEEFPFSYIIEATGSQPMNFNAVNLPAGLTISGNTISGIPTTAGTYNVTISASNGAGTDTKTLVITIAQGTANDTDGDGIADEMDAYPTDPERAFNSFYPNEVDYVSVAFEDLWPAYGDYDFNDFVINLNYKTVTNAQNLVVDVIVKYQIMADGASLDNGFGLVFDALPETVESVTGYIKLGNAIMFDPKGFEAGHTNETVVILVDNINPIMDGGMANTIPGGKYVQTTINTVTVNFSDPQQNIGTPPYNPFIFVDQVRSHEVHLKNQLPTEFVDEELYGTNNDASNPGNNNYYLSTTGLPWAIETPINFEYPVEAADILTAHLKFAAWAQSSGVDFPDWYMNKTGYRNDENIYVVPQ